MRHEIASLFAEFAPHQRLLEVSYLTRGLSNDNYYLRADDGGYLLKCYRRNWPGEALAAQCDFASLGLCPSPLWQDPERKVAIFEYHEGEEAKRFNGQLVEHLARIHDYSREGEALDLAEALAPYRAMAEFAPFADAVDTALATIARLPVTLGYCHNDLVADNIILTEAGITLIDFEYAGVNDVYFDLAALSLSYGMQDLEISDLLSLYHAQNGAQPKEGSGEEKLTCFRLIYGVLSYCWYVQRGARQQAESLRVQLMPQE